MAKGRVPLPKFLDLPPLWLVAFVAAAWGIDRVLPMDLFGRAGDAVAAVLGLAGVVLSGGAVAAMWRARTTVIPHLMPRALVTRGVFGLSRNPIYLADAAFLLAAILWMDAVAALPLVAGFMWLIRKRFIEGEEARLRAAFGDAFDGWAAKVRRWL